jgi:transcriptional regulator GlxA family with amidase domain
MEGKGHSKAELRKIGQELVDRVTQQYVYHRVMTEMQERKMHVVSEEVAEDKTVKIRVRNW